MRLSDAIAMGRVLINEPDCGSYCHCAIGMATASLNGEQMSDPCASFDMAMTAWPFLSSEVTDPFYKNETTVEWAISQWFIRVHLDKEPLEGLIDWVRSVEPAEESETQVLSAFPSTTEEVGANEVMVREQRS
jgi:hypothetical protein